MSRDNQTVLVYGWQLEPDVYEENEKELRSNFLLSDAESGDVVCVYDVFSGDYCYIGILSATTNSTRNGMQSFDHHLTIPEDIQPSQSNKNSLQNAVNKLGIPTNGKPQHYLFTHKT